MTDCIFCTRQGLEIIDENRYCFIIAPLDEYRPGHRLVILKNHKKDIASEISDDEMFAFIKTINEYAQLLKAVYHADKIYVFLMGDGVQHLHAHLIPRGRWDKTGLVFLAEQEKKFDAIRYPEESHKQ